ncbi:hypothetical protein NQZ68_004416 [Dissostichus eleginoides]|nr:hypothetical protein NQZ68_004416 [Dissostichus eleginoides]
MLSPLPSPPRLTEGVKEEVLPLSPQLEEEVRSAAFFQGGGPATSTSDPYQRGRQPYHSSHHAPVVRAF